MDVKASKQHLSYRIVVKPEGGYIATSSDPGCEPLEGATQEEVVEKVRQKTAALLGRALPADLFKLGGLTVKVHKKINISTMTNQAGAQPIFSKSDSMLLDGTSPAAIEPRGSGLGALLYLVGALVTLLSLAYLWMHR